MSTRTVSTVFDVNTSRATAGLKTLSSQAKTAAGATEDLQDALKDAGGVSVKPKVEVNVAAATKSINKMQDSLDTLDGMDVDPEVRAEIDKAKTQLDRAKSLLEDLDGDDATMKVDADTSGARKEIEDLGDAGESGGESAGHGISKGLSAMTGLIGGVAGGLIGGVASGLVGGITDMIGSVINSALSIDVGRDLFGARTGLDEATAAKFGRAAGEAYANNFGESIDDNMDTARLAMQQGLVTAKDSQREIQGVIEKLSGVSSLLGGDVSETIVAVSNLMKTKMATSVDDAMDAIVSGFQHGVDSGNDLMDTLTEYPSVVSKLGLSADEFMGMMVQSLQAGARNSDVAADALKEFQIRATDASTTSAAGFEAIGLNAEEMTAKIASGGDKAKEGLQQVLDALRGMEDPVARNTAGVALFGTKWEDMGDTLLAFDPSKAVDALGGIESVAGSAGAALSRMADNDASAIEEAKRNIEVAANGIAGALASAFSDDISGAADWVSKNRGPIMEFFRDAVNAALDFGKNFLGVSASILDGIGSLLMGLAELAAGIDHALPGDQHSKAFSDFAKSAQKSLGDTADFMRDDMTDALQDTEDEFNSWIGPEIMSAKVHDQIVAMEGDLDAFNAFVDSSGGTITINGDSMNAQEALDFIESNINETDGTVTINGETMPASDALKFLMDNVKNSKESITIGGKNDPAKKATADAVNNVKRQNPFMTINGNNANAKGSVLGAVNFAHAQNPFIPVNADLTAAKNAVEWWTPPSKMIRVSATLSMGLHSGGLVPGLAAGGKVPGSSSGYDNVLWPLASGGQTLTQPLEGGEFVVNSKATQRWLPVLEKINSGGTLTTMNNMSSVTNITVNAPLGAFRQVSEFMKFVNGMKSYSTERVGVV